MNLVTHFNVLIIVTVLNAEPFIEQPPDTLTVTKGDTIRIPCGIGSHITATLFWQNMATGDVITKGAVIDPEFIFPLDKRERYSVMGDIDIGEYTLQIRNVQGDDEAEYACFYYDETIQKEQQSNVVTLTVMLPPAEGYPMCSMEPEFNQPGDHVTITCESRGGQPPAALTWIREQDILDVQYQPNQEISYYRKSVLLTEDDVDVKFICVARNPATKHLPSCSLKPIRTSIVVNIEPEELDVTSGESAVLTCIGEDIPKLEYFWYINGRPVEDTQERYAIRRKGRRFVINPVIESDDLSLVTCVVEQYGPYNTATGSESALVRVERPLYPDISIPTIDIGFTDIVNLDSTTIVPIIETSIQTTVTDPVETSAQPTPTASEATAELELVGIPSVSARPHSDARCQGDACFEVGSSPKPKLTTRLVSLATSTTTETESSSSRPLNSLTHSPTNTKNEISSQADTTKTPNGNSSLITNPSLRSYPQPNETTKTSDANSNLITNPLLKSTPQPNNSSNNILCPNRACAKVISNSHNKTTTTPTDGIPVFPAMVTPPREKGQKPKSIKPVGGKTDVVMPLMLILALICFIVILIIIIMMRKKKKRSPDQKVSNMENQRPVVGNAKYPPKSPAQGRSGLKNQNKYSKTCTSYSSIF